MIAVLVSRSSGAGSTARGARSDGRRLLRPAWAAGLCVIALIVSGCRHFETSLNTPSPVAQTIERNAWLAPVEVADPTIGETSQEGVPATVDLGESLTLSLRQYIKEAGYFRKVGCLPGEVKEEDLVLRVSFDRYYQERAPHWAYFPAAILTATLYIWVGGPVYTDTFELSAALLVEDAQQNQLVSVDAALETRRHVTIYCSFYASPFGKEERTQLVKELLDEACAEIQPPLPEAE